MERTERREIIIPAGTAAGTIIPLDNIALDSNYPHVKGMAVIVDGPTEDFRIGLDNNGKTVIDDLDYKLFNVTNTPVNERFYELDFEHRNNRISIRCKGLSGDRTVVTCYFKLAQN